MSNTRMSAGNYSETSAEPCGYHVGGKLTAAEFNKQASGADVGEAAYNMYFAGSKTNSLGTVYKNLFLDTDGVTPVATGDSGVEEFKKKGLKSILGTTLMEIMGSTHVGTTGYAADILAGLSDDFKTKYLKDDKPNFTDGIKDDTLLIAYKKGFATGKTDPPPEKPAPVIDDYGFDVPEFLKKLKRSKIETTKDYVLDLGKNSVSDFISGTKWIHTADDTYKMIYKDDKDKEVTKVVSIKDQQSLFDLMAECFGTYIKDDKCKDTLMTVILEGDSEAVDKKVADIMKDPSGTFNAMGEEVSNIYPEIALKFLHRFGFREHKVPEPNSDRDIRKIEDASHWLQSKHIEDKFGKDTIEAMFKNNKELIYYLDILSQLVNNNPTILNPTYAGSGDEDATGQSQYTKELGIKERRERKDGDVGRLRSYIQHSRQFTSFPFMTPGLQQTLSLGKPVLNPIRTNQGLGTMYGPGCLTPFNSRYVTPGRSLMAGGANGDSYIRQFDDGEKGSRFGAKFIKKVFDNSIASLKAKRKTVADEAIIKKKLDDIIKSEEEVFKSVALIEWYNNLMNVTNNQTKETVSASKMQALIDRHQKLVKGYQGQEDVMLKILENLYTLKGETDYTPIDFAA